MAKFYDSGNEVYREIPKASYYVLSNDRFMSGWGRAKRMINTCVVPCRNYAQACWVERYAKSRGDQKYVRIVSNPPRSKAHVMYSLPLGWLKRAYDMQG
jgi:hypothetical protein